MPGIKNLPPFALVQGETKLVNRTELSQFLSTVERRAYKQALYAVRNEHAALDVVQDAMIKLAEKYGDKPAAELPLLFQRILQTTIRVNAKPSCCVTGKVWTRRKLPRRWDAPKAA